MNELSIRTDKEDQVLRVWYHPQTTHSIYDICDGDGSVIKTGELQEEGAQIDISDLSGEEYYLLIIDGEEMIKRRVELEPEGGES